MTRLLDTVLEIIRARRDEVEARFGIRMLGVVGSVARGEEREERGRGHGRPIVEPARAHGDGPRAP